MAERGDNLGAQEALARLAPQEDQGDGNGAGVSFYTFEWSRPTELMWLIAIQERRGVVVTWIATEITELRLSW